MFSTKAVEQQCEKSNDQQDVIAGIYNVISILQRKIILRKGQNC